MGDDDPTERVEEVQVSRPGPRPVGGTERRGRERSWTGAALVVMAAAACIALVSVSMRDLWTAGDDIGRQGDLPLPAGSDPTSAPGGIPDEDEGASSGTPSAVTGNEQLERGVTVPPPGVSSPTGVLRLDVSPTATLYIDDLDAGDTADPSRRIELPVGTNRVRMIRGTDGLEDVVSVDIAVDATTTLRHRWSDSAEERENRQAEHGGVSDAATEPAGALRLAAYPPARVFVDGHYVGTTAETATGVVVASGEHEIRLVRTTDHHAETFTLVIEAGELSQVLHQWSE